jgi:hypothetical protein
MPVLDTFTADAPTFVYLEDADPQSKKEHRMANCSTHYPRQQNPSTGKWKAIVWRCGYMECPVCRGIEVSKRKNSLLSTALAGDAQILEGLEEDEVKEMCREIGAPYYRRFPQEDGTYTLIFQSADYHGRLYTQGVHDRLDWDTIAIAPKGKRVTGKLGVRTAVGNTPTVKVAEVSAPSATEEQWKSAAEDVARITKHFNPKTRDEVERALDKRAQMLMAKLQALGVGCKIKYVQVPFTAKEVNWQDNRAPIMETAQMAKGRQEYFDTG